MQPVPSSLPVIAGLFCAPLGVLVVNAFGPPGSITDIQTACNMAAERDVILVKTGSYSPVDVVDKWLTIAADAGANVNVNGGIRVRNLDAGRRVTLIGLTSSGNLAGNPGIVNGLELTANQGPIRVVNCTFQGVDGSLAVRDGEHGIVATSTADVAFSRCTSMGGRGLYGAIGYAGPPGRGGTGARVTNSSVALYNSNMRGGDGWNGAPDAGSGGDGYVAWSSQLLASRTNFQGGSGGNGQMWGGTGGDGGYGIVLSGSPSVGRLISTTEFGGYGGTSYYGLTNPQEASGYPRAGGTFIDLPVIGRSMTLAQDPIRESSTVGITLEGQTTDRVVLVVSPITTSAFNPVLNGQQLFPLLPTTSYVGAGLMPGSSLTYSLTFPDLGPGVQSRTYLIQPMFSGLDGNRVLGTPVSLLVLDSAF